MAEPGIPPARIAQLDAIRERQQTLRSAVRASPMAAFAAGRDAARDAHGEQTAAAADTARLWASLSLIITGKADQVREHLAGLADLDLVAALGEAGRALAEVCAEVTRGTRS